ncbi:hypothetical protein ACVIGB_001032 [Bradyrhizobium sp. USDA 4341]
MQDKVTKTKAKAIIEAARDTAPVWAWESFEGDPRRRYGRRAVGRIDIGDLSFSINFYGAGHTWEIHWGPHSRTQTGEVLRAYGGGAGAFRKIVVCMRDMIEDFLSTAHPDEIRMNCASEKHAALYAELLPSAAGQANAFKTIKSDRTAKAVLVKFLRSTDRRRPHGFDPRRFSIEQPQVPTEFEAAPSYSTASGG